MLQDFKGHSGIIHSIAFSPTNRDLLVTASADRTAKVCQLGNHAQPPN